MASISTAQIIRMRRSASVQFIPNSLLKRRARLRGDCPVARAISAKAGEKLLWLPSSGENAERCPLLKVLRPPSGDLRLKQRNSILSFPHAQPNAEFFNRIGSKWPFGGATRVSTAWPRLHRRRRPFAAGWQLKMLRLSVPQSCRSAGAG